MGINTMVIRNIVNRLIIIKFFSKSKKEIVKIKNGVK